MRDWIKDRRERYDWRPVILFGWYFIIALVVLPSEGNPQFSDLDYFQQIISLLFWPMYLGCAYWWYRLNLDRKPRPEEHVGIDMNDRAAVQLVDAIMGFVVLVTLLVLAPHIYNFLGMVKDVADPFSATLLQLFVPFLFLAILISIGVSARRGGA